MSASLADISRDVVARLPQEPPPRETGTYLFDLLLTGRCKDLFHMTEGFVAATGRGLRMVFKIALEDRGGPWLQSIPWELLYQQSKHEFVALMKKRSIIRYLKILQPLGTADLPFSSRLLAVASQPAGLEGLDLPAEKVNLGKVWPATRLKVLCNPTIDDIAAEIGRDVSYHIFHFMGHGGFANDEGRLFFISEGGGTACVDGPTLSTTLSFQREDFRLVFLNACRTGQVGTGRQSDPFAGFATALTIQGVPAVVAMRERISDAAAIRFSEAIYHRLEAGQTLDEAVNEGRRVLRLVRDQANDEWSQPILFLRSLPPSADFWGRLYAGLSKLPTPLRRLGTWGGAISGFLLGLLLVATLAILQCVTPSEIPWVPSFTLLGLTTATGTLLGRARFVYDVRALALSAVLLLALMAVRLLVPRRADVPLASVGNLSAWMADTLPPDRWIDFAMVHEGCRSDSCLQFTYYPGGGFAGIYWIPWKCDGGDVAGRDCSINLSAGDASRIRRLSFYARGERGGEVLEFKVGGDDFAPTPVKLSNVSLSREWRRYTIPLEGVDLTNAVGLFAWFAADAFNSDDITFYLDEIVFDGVFCPLDRE